MKGQKESLLQKAILNYVKLRRYLLFKHQNVGIQEPNGSYPRLTFEEKGISDIIGCLPDG
jgi:hypothetical protein